MPWEKTFFKAQRATRSLRRGFPSIDSNQSNLQSDEHILPAGGPSQHVRSSPTHPTKFRSVILFIVVVVVTDRHNYLFARTVPHESYSVYRDCYRACSTSISRRSPYIALPSVDFLYSHFCHLTRLSFYPRTARSSVYDFCQSAHSLLTTGVLNLYYYHNIIDAQLSKFLVCFCRHACPTRVAFVFFFFLCSLPACCSESNEVA